MKKEKKDALTLSCEEYYKRVGCENKHCPGYSKYCDKHCLNDETCIKRIKQHFQKQADISDGWDVVKILFYKAVLNPIRSISHPNKKCITPEKYVDELVRYSLKKLTENNIDYRKMSKELDKEVKTSVDGDNYFRDYSKEWEKPANQWVPPEFLKKQNKNKRRV